MNDIQSIPLQKHGNPFTTLNLLFSPRPIRILGHYAYSYLVLSTDFVPAQYELTLLNAQAATGLENRHHHVFPGTWTRYGFHEDGFASGLHAAAALPGLRLPFAIADADAERRNPTWT
jgi:predicted NAD/FAD-binding protein